MDIPDIRLAPVELPYSGDGYIKNVVSRKVENVKKADWIKMRRTWVCMPPDSYEMIKNTFYKQCYNSQCKQALDSAGEIFQMLDDGVKAVYGK
jgi:hypothetical protein